MAENRTARVDLRHHTLAEAAEYVSGPGPNGSDGFIALAQPPPVGSVVHVHPDGRALAVTQVTESAEGSPGPGIYVRDATAEDLERHDRIGTEHMAPSSVDPSAGDAGSDPTLPEDATSADVSHAVPAPVTEPEPSEPISVDKDQPSIQGTLASTPDETEPNRGSRGKRRKGRRRS